jgi:tryptophan-rich sensory protein
MEKKIKPKDTTLNIAKNIFLLLLPYIIYSTTYLVPDFKDLDSDEYKNMHQSKLSLPVWLQFMIWCLIYITMGSSLVKVIYKKKYLILFLYFIQIITNFIRSLYLYKKHDVNGSLFMSFFYLLSVIMLNSMFYKRSKKSGQIFFIYTLWSIYIFYLHLAIKFKLF